MMKNISAVTLPLTLLKAIKQLLPRKGGAMFEAVHNNQGIFTHEICQGVYLNNASDVALKTNIKLKFFGLELKCEPPVKRLKDAQNSWHWYLVRVSK